MPEKNYKSELVGVFGHPVSENPTIIMQEAAFKALGLNFRYLTIEVSQRIWKQLLRASVHVTSEGST